MNEQVWITLLVANNEWDAWFKERLMHQVGIECMRKESSYRPRSVTSSYNQLKLVVAKKQRDETQKVLWDLLPDAGSEGNIC